MAEAGTAPPHQSGSAGVSENVAFAGLDARLARRAFRAARRHTLFVRTLRLLLPTIAAAAVVVFAMQVRTPSPPDSEGGKGGFDVGDIKVTSAGFKMVRPRYKGFTDEGGEYTVTAATAQPVLSQPGRVHLWNVDGTLLQPNGQRLQLNAAKGFFDNDKGLLYLSGGIDVSSADGMKARLTHATVYINQQRIESDKPVTAQSLNGTIRADTMVIMQKRQEIIFAGGVKVRILKKAQQPSTKPGSIAK